MKEEEYILKQIEKAKIAVNERKCYFCLPSEEIVMEFMNLEIGSSRDIWHLIGELLGELKPNNCIKTDIKIHETSSGKLEFYTFEWESLRLNKKIKFIFGLNDDHFYYFSLS